MTSLGRSISSGGNHNPSSGIKHGGRSHLGIGHTTYIKHVQAKVQRLLKIINTLNDLNADFDDCFISSGMNNRTLFKKGGNNKKSQLLSSCHIVLDELCLVPKPYGLSQQDGLQLEKNRKILDGLKNKTTINSIRDRIANLDI